jgi:hypothetical protein
MISPRPFLSPLAFVALAGCAAAASPSPSDGLDTSTTTTPTASTGAGGSHAGGSGGSSSTGGAGGAHTSAGGAGHAGGGGAGHGGAGGHAGGAGGGGTPCGAASDCPGTDGDCAKRACNAGTCGVDDAPKGTIVANQVPGDCKQLVCDGNGASVSNVDDGDVPVDGNPCTNDVCTAGVPSNPPAPAGLSCGPSLECDGAGNCAGCLKASECPGQDGECQTRTCTNGTCGFDYAAAGTPLNSQVAGDCHERRCDGNGGVTNAVDDGDVPVDGKQCTSDACNAGVPSNPPVGPGGACNQNGGTLCDGKGACVQCLTASTCPGQDTECQSRACTNGACGVANQPKGTPLQAQIAGDCRSAQCDGAGNPTVVNDDADVPVDGNDCTKDVCTNGVPSNPPAAAEALCAQNGGKVCDGKGACVECASNADCASQLCANGACLAGSCKDGVQNGSETGVDCGGSCAPCPVVLVLAGGSASMFGAEWHPGGAWGVTPLAGVTVDGVSLAALASGVGVGLMRFTKLADPQDNLLLYALYTPATLQTPSAWSAFAPIGPTVATRGQPAIDAAGATAQVAFHGMDYKHYYAAYNGAWTPPAEPAGTPQSYGPSPATIAARGGDATIVFHDGAVNNATSSRDRTAGTWLVGTGIGTGADFGVTPLVVALSAGPELIAVWERSDHQLVSSTRTAGAWSAPAAIANALSTVRPALAALPNGGAVLAFHGTDGKLYTSLYAAGAWGAVAGIASPNVSLAGTPAVAHGVGGDTVELAYVGNDGVAYHARYASGAWKPVTAVGGSSLVSVAIASAP